MYNAHHFAVLDLKASKRTDLPTVTEGHHEQTDAVIAPVIATQPSRAAAPRNSLGDPTVTLQASELALGPYALRNRGTPTDDDFEV